MLTSHLKEWTLPRLPAVDRAILRLAAWELFNTPDVPPVVVVDEAVELAKELSTDDSPAFVNGVLGRMVHLAPQFDRRRRRSRRARRATHPPDRRSARRRGAATLTAAGAASGAQDIL